MMPIDAEGAGIYPGLLILWILALPLRRAASLGEAVMAHRAELCADAFAARQGYGVPLAETLLFLSPDGCVLDAPLYSLFESPTHPSSGRRFLRLLSTPSASTASE